MTVDIAIRNVEDTDGPGLWAIIREVASTGETMPMDPSPARALALSEWATPPPGRAVVAVEADGAIAGTANMYVNRPAQGSHIASGSILVADWARDRGVGRALVQDMVEWARESGFAGVQFNAVVETNTPAVELYLPKVSLSSAAAPRRERGHHR